MALRIPSQHQRSLARLEALMPSADGSLPDRLRALPGFSPASEIKTALLRTWPTLDDIGAMELTTALVSVSTQLNTWDASDLGPAIAGSPDLDISDDSRPAFGAFISALLDASALQTTSKAISVLAQQDRLFHEARIMSDIRPVFGSDAAKRPEGGVVVHTLCIEHHGAEGIRTFTVAMTKSDLRDLQDSIDRAMLKAGSLSEVMDSAGLALFELEEADDGSP